MYTVRADVVDNGAGGAVVDSVTVPIGVRDALWTPNEGFVLNGFKVLAKGFSQVCARAWESPPGGCVALSRRCARRLIDRPLLPHPPRDFL